MGFEYDEEFKATWERPEPLPTRPTRPTRTQPTPATPTPTTPMPTPATPFIDILFDGPPGPTAGRFVDVVDSGGRGVILGEWLDHGDGYWTLRLPQVASSTPEEGR